MPPPRKSFSSRRIPHPSLATGGIDRYVPGQDSPVPLMRSNPLSDPLTLDYQVGFSWFAEWWRNEQAVKEAAKREEEGGAGGENGDSTRRPRNGRESREEREKERARIQEAYEQYKVDFNRKMAVAFVTAHRSEEWFKEKYDKTLSVPIRRSLMEYRKRTALQRWNGDLASGAYDDLTLEGIPKAAANGTENARDGSGGADREEDEAAVAAGVQDLVPAHGASSVPEDPALHAPALLIKTLAPNVGRAKIEEFCRDALGEAAGGFDYLSLSDPNPTKKFHRMGWIMLKLDPDAGQTDADRSGGDARGEEEAGRKGDDADGGDPPKSAAQATAENALPFVNGKAIHDPMRGDFTAHIGVHAPQTHTRRRALWNLFSAPVRIERDLALAKRLVRKLDAEMGESVDSVRQIEERVDALSREGKLVVTTEAGTAPRPDADSTMDDVEAVEEGEADEGEISHGSGGDDGDDGDEEAVDSPTLLAQKKELDLLVEYLRRVHNFCFFCVFETDSVHELIRRCPGGHLRRPRSSLSKLALQAAKASAEGKPFPLDGDQSKGPAPHASTKKPRSAADEDVAMSDAEEGEEDGEDEVKDTSAAAKPRSYHPPRKYTSKSQQQLSRAFNWVRTFEDKVLQVLDPEHADLARLGGRPLQEALDAALQRFISQEDESRFRCKVPECTKMFKAEHFWRKHVEKRHTEFCTAIVDELELVNAYVLDPGRIVPGRDGVTGGHGGGHGHHGM
ncbi:hypothetical protein KEM52_002548, partial [Ascosphaera acerosa]